MQWALQRLINGFVAFELPTTATLRGRCTHGHLNLRWRLQAAAAKAALS
jgi:hypothetical protein